MKRFPDYHAPIVTQKCSSKVVGTSEFGPASLPEMSIESIAYLPYVLHARNGAPRHREGRQYCPELFQLALASTKSNLTSPRKLFTLSFAGAIHSGFLTMPAIWKGHRLPGSRPNASHGKVVSGWRSLPNGEPWPLLQSYLLLKSQGATS